LCAIAFRLIACEERACDVGRLQAPNLIAHERDERAHNKNMFFLKQKGWQRVQKRFSRTRGHGGQNAPRFFENGGESLFLKGSEFGNAKMYFCELLACGNVGVKFNQL
jgi:hypothetical protein